MKENINARIMFIGPSGQVLNKLLLAAGIDRELVGYGQGSFVVKKTHKKQNHEYFKQGKSNQEIGNPRNDQVIKTI